MEWLGGTVSKEDVGEEGTGKRQLQHHNKRKRDEDGDEDALGAFALRFKCVSVYESLSGCLNVCDQAFGILPKPTSTTTDLLFEGS